MYFKTTSVVFKTVFAEKPDTILPLDSCPVPSTLSRCRVDWTSAFRAMNTEQLQASNGISRKISKGCAFSRTFSLKKKKFLWKSMGHLSEIHTS
jgi:hypothetical protein